MSKLVRYTPKLNRLIGVAMVPNDSGWYVLASAVESREAALREELATSGDTIECMRKERVRAEEREAALREEIATLKFDARLVELLGTPDQFAVDQDRHRIQLRLDAALRLLAASHTHVKQVGGTGIATARILASQIEDYFDERRELARQALSPESQRITPATPMQSGYKCLACGDVHGGLGLPCPKMALMAKGDAHDQ